MRRERGAEIAGRTERYAARGDPLNGLALCAGAAGLELGMRLVFGDRYRCVGYVERDAFAAASLVARMEDETLDRAPVWDDLSTFDGRPWRGRVDFVTAGFPCQPVSEAGQQLGVEDERWLWPDVARVVEEAAPAVAFFENVPPLVTLGLDVVVGDLARLGFDVQWSDLSAAAVGATQRRERLWILAYRHGLRLHQLGWEPRDDGLARNDARRSSSSVLARADGGRGRVRTGRTHDEGRGVESADRGGDVAVSVCEGQQGPARHALSSRAGSFPGSGEVPLFPPRPDALDEWRTVLGAAPDLEPSLHRMADGLANRVDRHRTIGNGVVPLVAASAFVGLADRAHLWEVEGVA